MDRIDIQLMLSECFAEPTWVDIAKWIEWQKGVVKLLSQNLEREKSHLSKVIAKYGDNGQWYRPDISYSTISNLGYGLPQEGSIEFKYNQKWTWKEKLLYILHWEGRPLTIIDFEDALRKIEVSLMHKTNLNNTVAVYLGRLVKDNQVVRYKIPRIRAGYYAHHTWYDEDGKLKDRYRKKGFI